MGEEKNMILPTTYMGSVEWYRRFLANPSAVQIEVMESFPKQTYRNRCTISQAIGRKGDEVRGERREAGNSLPLREGQGVGLLTLSVPVKRADSKQLTCDVEISYQQRWQHQHWIALMSAYKRTPYFDYYADFFHPFYVQETRFLVDFNEKIHEVIVELMKNNASVGVKKDNINNFCAAPTLRLAKTTDWQGLDLEPCFGNGQSILDLLFEYGPETIMKI